MASDVRERMMRGTMQLLARDGFEGASLADIVAFTGTPRGSIYHYFPGGKDEVVNAALDLAEQGALRVLDETDGEPALRVAERFLGLWRTLLERSDFSAGCSVLGVTVSAGTPDVVAHAAEIFRRWRADLADRLTRGGLHPELAGGAAALLISAAEGAVVLSRAEHSMEPLDTVSAELLGYLGGLLG